MDIEKLRKGQATIGVVGLGYVGLPLVLLFRRAGHRLIGLDIDKIKVEKLGRGESYIHHIPASDIAEASKGGSFVATTDFSRASECDAVIICVPTPLTQAREPDLSFITSTGEALAPHVKKGQLVVLESTTYPGTTDEVLKPILEKHGLVAGRDFFLAFSPERENPGSGVATRTVPKVVGGFDGPSLEMALALYGSGFERTVPVSSTRVAELVKLLENIYRSVNIALVNELKMLCDRMGLDVWEVIEAAATKPFGYQPFYPGPGLGGHCIPIDPFYLTWKAREYGFSTRFIELAGEINTAMPEYVIHQTMEALNRQGKALKGSKVLVLGAAYKKDVDDMRESPSIELMELLLDRGAAVSYHDPYVPKLPKMRKHDLGLVSVPLTDQALGGADVVLIATDHSNVDYGRVVAKARFVVDTRNATKGVREGRERILKA